MPTLGRSSEWCSSFWIVVKTRGFDGLLVSCLPWVLHLSDLCFTSCLGSPHPLQWDHCCLLPAPHPVPSAATPFSLAFCSYCLSTGETSLLQGLPFQSSPSSRQWAQRALFSVLSQPLSPFPHAKVRNLFICGFLTVLIVADLLLRQRTSKTKAQMYLGTMP